VDISTCISVIHLFIYHPPSIFITTSPFITMPIDLSNLSAKDVAAATTAMEADRRACEERKHQEAENQQRWQEEERAHQEATAQREAEGRKEAEERKEVETWKAEAEQRERLA
jgi:hypothetical protein